MADASIPSVVGSTVGGWVAAINTVIGLINSRFASRPYVWADATARAAQTGMSTGEYGYQSDTTITYRYSGSAWVAWNSPWFTRTPTLNNITLGTGGTSYFRARYVEGDIEEKLKVAFGTSGAAWTTSPNWTLLAAPDPLSYAAISQVGRGSAYDASATIDYDITANWTGSGSTVNLYVRGTAATYLALGIITASAPFTPATNDTVTVRLAYTPA